MMGIFVFFYLFSTVNKVIKVCRMPWHRGGIAFKSWKKKAIKKWAKFATLWDYMKYKVEKTLTLIITAKGQKWLLLFLKHNALKI